MPHELDRILIPESQSGFDKQFKDIRRILLHKAMFGGFDKESENNRDKVLEIIRDVDEQRYKAVRKYTKEYDGVDISRKEFRVSKEALEKAHKEIDKDLLVSIRKAIKNIREYQTKIFIGKKSDLSGETGIRYTPIRRVGICVPGASAPLPSTVIMTAVPAQVAGVKEIVVISPPRYNKDIHPVTLAACYELKIDKVYRAGGVQGVAALVTIAKVNKIVGPGNQWVQTAKLMVFGYVGIDSVAGPSEVLIIANDKANPAWVAADMLSQAEHAPGSAIVFTDSNEVGKKILDELKKQAGQLSRAKETIECLKKYSAIIVFDSFEHIISWANNLAPEHLEIQCGDKSREIADKIKNAGAIFIGDYSPVAVGDYWAGPSHTLPTGGGAKFSSALTSNDFIKSISIIEYDKEKLAQSAEDIIRLAEAEGLDAHAKSVKIRQQNQARSKS